MGLVSQVITSLRDQNVQRLSGTYLTVMLPKVVESIGFKDEEEAEQYILRMIHRGQLNASINEEGHMVAFKDDAETYNKDTMITYLDRQIHATMALNQKIAAVDRSIELSDRYVQKMIQSERGAALHDEHDTPGMTG